MDWTTYFLNIAETVRTKSKDPSSQVGAVIVGPEKQIVSTGFNGFPRHIDDGREERWRPEKKLYWIEHAERNAIYNAARHGIALRGCTMYLVGFGPPTVPCVDCARAIIQSGIGQVVGRPYKPTAEHWVANLATAQQMLQEAGVSLWEEEELVG